ncbi:nuclear transport factor 2 family protein [Clavibacter sp. Sh2141]|uniref:nuclear transport factor 2 family protein n=1 Tax=Clavibacter sp. Sh2141 TaxID=3395374 RepID=UPI0039BCC1C7
MTHPAPIPTPTDLPEAVQRYLDGREAGEPSAAAAPFAEDAVVEDDGRTYRGREEIAAWRTGAAAAFRYTSTRLATTVEGTRVVLVDRLEGDFPGGRVDLTSAFALDEAGAIASLRIAVAD